MPQPQPGLEPEAGPAGRPAGRDQLGEDGFRLERVVEPVHGPDRGPVEEPLPLARAVDLPLRGDLALLVHQRLQREADRGIRNVLEDDEDGPIEHLLELERELPPDDRAGRVGDLGQVQALRGRIQVVLLERADERAKHRVRRSEIRRDVAGFLPLAGREGLLPEEQPHLRQVPQRLAGEQPSAVRHPVERELGLLALADLAIRTVLVVRDHDRRDVGRSEDELELERQPAPGLRSPGIPERSRQATASSILLGSSSVRFMAIRNVRTVALGERNRGSTDATAGPARVPFAVVFAGATPWPAKTGKEPKDPLQPDRAPP